LSAPTALLTAEALHCGYASDQQLDANARFLRLGLKKAVAIDLPIDIKEVLVADQKKPVAVVVRTMRTRSTSSAPALGKDQCLFLRCRLAGRSSR